MRRLADSATMRPFLNQVTVGGGTALDSHSRLTDFPMRTFTARGESPLESLMLGGTARNKVTCEFKQRSASLTGSGRGLTENCEVDVLVRLPRCVHGHAAVASPVRHFGLQNLERPAAWKQQRHRCRESQLKQVRAYHQKLHVIFFFFFLVSQRLCSFCISACVSLSVPGMTRALVFA